MGITDKTVAEEQTLAEMCAALEAVTGHVWTTCRLSSAVVFFYCKHVCSHSPLLVVKFPYPEWPSRHVSDGGDAVKGTVILWGKYEYSEIFKGPEPTVEKEFPTTWGTRLADSVKAISEHFASL